MRFRAGLLIGFGVGYYLGTAAGKERHEQLNEWLGKVRGSEAMETATEKAKAVVDLSVERARDFVEDRAGDDLDPTGVGAAITGTKPDDPFIARP